MQDKFFLQIGKNNKATNETNHWLAIYVVIPLGRNSGNTSALE